MCVCDCLQVRLVGVTVCVCDCLQVRLVGVTVCVCDCLQVRLVGVTVCVCDCLQVRLVFHNDDQSSHSLTVDGRTTVAHVCDQLVQCNHAMHSPHWTVVERLARYQLGQLRPLRFVRLT